MKDSYFLTPRKAYVCRMAGAVFLLCAMMTGLGVVIRGVIPDAQSHCIDRGCAVSMQTEDLLDAEMMAQVQSSPAAEQTYATFVRRPVVRLGIIGITLIEAGPFALMLFGVGLALRRLGIGGRDALARALKWLRRASQAALFWAIARALSDSLMHSLLSGGTPDGAQWEISLDFTGVGTALMLGIAAFATAWALEEGLKAQRDLADFV